jgi:hypothetical protein
LDYRETLISSGHGPGELTNCFLPTLGSWAWAPSSREEGRTLWFWTDALYMQLRGLVAAAVVVWPAKPVVSSSRRAGRGREEGRPPPLSGPAAASISLIPSIPPAGALFSPSSCSPLVLSLALLLAPRPAAGLWLASSLAACLDHRRGGAVRCWLLLPRCLVVMGRRERFRFPSGLFVQN